MGGNVCLRCKGKTLSGVVNKLLHDKKKFVDINYIAMFALLPEVYFPANNFNFTEGEGDGIKYRLTSSIFSILVSTIILH